MFWNPGDKVRVTQRTGEYIAEVLEIHDTKLLVKVLAVTKYPQQGDLHTSYEVDVPLFHQRPALSYQEKFMTPAASVIRYNGEVPDYKESVRKAMEREMEKLKKMAAWSERCLVELEAMYKETFTNTK
ncbi:kinase-associated lipoprotein B [Brevibacillus agri]|uniref:Kinase n=1 Tax=Brevibacillus agri TaxID=51101 RepID=A0A3M8AZU8_9BACL|nr:MULTISPECIES: sporulation phosphorelay system protein KapB [Brevibacillus]ELK42994.1 kinase-associated protein B [Brevibacillus agri BAB-2500]EJL44086.1 Kinase associated protein B [Brevibacillus sp. CF112]MBG9564523.1 kinase [Brevibacillus agri]MBY0053105.1 kinase [Brevibacillus agri]MCG5253311.1 kinase-associated lipoprotein B [Brevibacillus agri]